MEKNSKKIKFFGYVVSECYSSCLLYVVHILCLRERSDGLTDWLASSHAAKLSIPTCIQHVTCKYII